MVESISYEVTVSTRRADSTATLPAVPPVRVSTQLLPCCTLTGTVEKAAVK
ncbi:hypothetical protein [Streptomyces sp. NPDC002994]|uniref:hypothetical protein n=1 Tax=Streptomyces sp. NPDC002994 TaxID=3154441 RepID=UPI0033A01612